MRPPSPFRIGGWSRLDDTRGRLPLLAGWDNPALEHLIKSKGTGAKDYKAKQAQLKKERLKKLGIVRD